MRILFDYMAISIQKCATNNVFPSSYVPFTETIVQFRYIILTYISY